MVDINALLDLDPEVMTEEESAVLLEMFPKPESTHDENLAVVLEGDDAGRKFLSTLGADVEQHHRDDEESREEWQYREREGIRLMGVSENVIDGATFEGASEVVYPGLTEAVIQFSSRAMAELWPADGPVKTVVMGSPDPAKYEQSKRVEGYMNYLYTEAMPGAFEETDKMLFRLPLSGSAFVKLCYDPLERQIVKRYLPANDVVFPYEAADVRTAPRYTVVTKYSPNDLKRLQKNGYYRDIEIQKPYDERSQQRQTLIDEVDDTDSKERTQYDQTDRHVILEHFCYLDIPGFEDPDGIALPYYVHVEAASETVLAIYRAWNEGDEDHKPVHYLIHYKFFPGFGFYGYGFFHILSHIARAETGALRALLDAAQAANMPGGFRTRDVRFKDPEKPISPMEWRECETTAEDLGKAFFPLPYKEPSPTLFSLLQWMDEVHRRVAGTTEVAVGDAPNNAPVGTTLALIEQSQRPQSAIHIRLHKAQKQEFKLLHDLCAKYLDHEYPYDVPGQSRVVKATDFDGRVDVIPVSDPNVISATQRVALAQAQLELATQNPQLYNLHAVNRRVLDAMRVPFPEEILPPEEEVPHLDPMSENMRIQTMQPVQAYPDQNHQAHMMVHMHWLNTLDPETRKMVEGPAMAHLAEHQALAYQTMMLEAMGQIPQDEETLTMMAAQVAQVMQSQPQPDPEAMALEAEQRRKDAQAQADIARRDESAMAEIRRKDFEASNKVAREDAEAIAKTQREVAQQEVDLVRDFVSDETKQAGEQV